MKVALLLLFVSFCFAANDIYMAGDFLLTIEESDGSLDHVASIVSYNPDEDTYIDTFDGGVFLESGFVNVLEQTPLGVFGAGVFRFMDDDHDYCNSVLRYNNDDDDFEGIHDGIYLRSSESVNFISGTNDATYFAGVFSAIEYLDEDNEQDVFVPNIAKINSDYEWSLLDNSDSVFPGEPRISSLSCSDDNAYIYASSSAGITAPSLFSYNDDDGFTLLNTIDLFGDIVADDDENVIGFQLTNELPDGSGAGTYNFVYFDKDSYDSPTIMELFTIAGNECVNGTVSLTPLAISWSNGFLITIPDVSTGCESSTWAYYDQDQESLDLSYSVVPDIDDVDLMVEGDDNDLWIATHSSSGISYLPTNTSQWVDVDLSSFGTFTVYAMTWDNGPDRLLVYGAADEGMKLMEINTDAFPPTVEEKSPGVLANPGIVSALAVMDDPDDDDYELYIGGTFESIGTKSISNFARFKQGNYDEPIPNSRPIAALGTSGSTVVYATNECVTNGDSLPIGFYSKDNEDLWVEFPVLIGGSGCVTTIFADERFVFFGGSFSVSLPGSSTIAHGIVYLDISSGEWKDVGIPNTVSSSGFAYDIHSISVANVNGTDYLAVGGYFDFTQAGQTYHGFAVSDLTTGTWLATPAEFDAETVVNTVLIDEISEIYIAGALQLAQGGTEEGVFAFNLGTNQYVEIGNLPTEAESLILHTYNDGDEDEYTDVYAGGRFVNGTNYMGLVFTESTSSPTTSWTRAATESQFKNFFTGNINDMVYTSGGIGANDTNGNDPSYTPYNTGGDGMSGWGIFFLTSFILLVVVVIVVAVVGGAVVYMRKRQNYQEL